MKKYILFIMLLLTVKLFAGATVVGKNKYNNSDLLDTYWQGVGGYLYVQGAGFKTSNYIKVNPSTLYTASGFAASGSGFSWGFYDADHGFINSYALSTTTFSFTTPSNAEYLVFCYERPGQVDMAKYVQIEEGGSATSYESYYTYTLPDAPSLSSPSNGATGEYNPTLYWNSSSGASGYYLQVATDAGFSGLVVDGDVGGSTSYGSSATSWSQTYYWRVYAYNAGNSDWSDTWSFTNQDIPVPATPTLSSPSNGATEQTPNLSLSWGGVTYASGYHLQVSVNGNMSPPLYDSDIGSTSVSSGGWSSYSTTYYWRVYAYNSSGNSSYTSTRSFTTNMLPLTPTAGSATSVTQTSFRANWSSASYATNYKIDIGTTSGGTQIANNVTTGNQTYYDKTGLSTSTTYYYRIRSTNTYGTSGNSGNTSLTTVVATPSAPTIGSASNITTSGFRANWGSASLATDYYIDIGTTDGGTQITNNQSTGGNIYYDKTGLNPNTKYYYLVRAYNVGGTSGNSSSTNLTTVALNTTKKLITFNSSGISSKRKILGNNNGIK